MSGVYGGPWVLAGRALRHGVDRGRLGAFLALLTQMALSVPGGVASRMRDRWKPLEPLRDPPLFILGHYRSGTSLLHKLLAADDRMGTVDTFDLLFPFAPPRLKRRALPPLQALVDLLGVRQGFFHDYPLRLYDPNEVEPWLLATGSPWSTYWGYLFPKRGLHYLDRFVRFPDPITREGWMRSYDHCLRRAAARAGGRPLVVKDPPNTGRIGALLELWPEARFVHVRRDPRNVLLSMRSLWRSTILPRFALQRVGDDVVDEVVSAHYEAVMGRWEAEHPSIPEGRCVELRYEDLVSDPLAAVERSYQGLSLPDLEPARRAVEDRIALDRDYEGGRYAADAVLPASWEPVVARWRRRLGYAS